MRPGCAAFLGLPLTGSGFSGMSHAVRACPRQRPHIVQRPTLATQALLLSWVAEGPYPGLLGAAPPCEQAICLASSRRAQNDLLAVVLQCPSYLGISGPSGNAGEENPQQPAIRCSVSPRLWADQGAWAIRGWQSPTAALLSSSLG